MTVDAPVDAAWLKAAGTSPTAVRAHYDLSDRFFSTWLGEQLVYSCAWWSGDEADDLATAQTRKLDHFAVQGRLAGARVLDIGCGWGALLDRAVTHHGAAGGVGLTLSPAQARRARDRAVPGVEYRVESWVDHRPTSTYDAITCIEATEHLASDRLDEDAKVEVYRSFFETCRDWLRDRGRLCLQLICLDDVSHRQTRPGLGAVSELFRTQIFPESMPAALSELVLGWETWFRLVDFLEHSDHYRRTFRAWHRQAAADRATMIDAVGEATTRTFFRYFAAGEACFRLREHALYRVVLEARDRPKRWATRVVPSALAPHGSMQVSGESGASSGTSSGASPGAVQAHYDVADDFFRLWLGPRMSYTSGWWDGVDDEMSDAEVRKLDRFADLVLPGGTGRVLDVGCGWAWAIRRLAERRPEGGELGGTGLTLSRAQVDHAARHPVPGFDVRLEAWEDHRPTAPYDAIVSFGALEHFARDGADGAARVAAYRRFFARCAAWLVEGGRLGLEAITYDDAPDTASRLGRGPLGDAVLEIFPESGCPHLRDLVLGFEPWFQVEVLRADAADFARTCRAWSLRLRRHDAEATRLIGPTEVRRWRRYLAASEVQFRDGTITNVRLVLRRRERARH